MANACSPLRWGCVDSTSGSKVRVNRENFGVGKTKSQPAAQASLPSELDGDAGVVGVPHSSVDLLYFKKSREPRGGRLLNARRRCEGHGDGPEPIGIRNAG